MALPKNILFPVDFSERSRQLWPAVKRMAQELGAPVTLLHVIDTARLAPTELEGEQESIRNRIHEKLHRFPDAEPRVSSLTREVREGAPAECIVQYAAGLDAPLIMMATRGHTRFRQLLLGSVTAAVLHDAACPVWTEAHTENLTFPQDGYRSVLCAVDMGAQTTRLLKAADEFSRQFGASLAAVHSIPRGDARFANALSDRAHSLLVYNAREEFAACCGKAHIEPPLEIVEDGSVVEGVVSAAERQQADLLVIGRGVIQGTLGRLRSCAHDLIRRSPCPVLSI